MLLVDLRVGTVGNFIDVALRCWKNIGMRSVFEVGRGNCFDGFLQEPFPIAKYAENGI
jgi:hypothetical protein